MSEYTQTGAGPGATAMHFGARHLGPVFEVAARTGSAYSKAYLAWQDEILRFTSTRFQRDAEFGTNLLKCDKWADAARLQQSWVTSAVEDYVNEANKLMELATSLTNDVARSARDTARTAGREAGRAAEEAGEQAGAIGEGASRFARAAGESAGAAMDESRKTAELAGEHGRKFGEEMSGNKDRGTRRR